MEFAAIVDADYVLVVQGCGEVGLTVEALTELLAGGELGGQDLECVAPGQSGVLRQVHLTHSART